MGDRSRRWCFTLNNYTAEDEAKIQSKDIPFVIYGRERAPTTGTPHLQGYLELADRGKTLSATKKMLGLQTVHLIIARGTAEENINYCSKGGDFFVQGSPQSARVPGWIFLRYAAKY